MRNMVEQGQMSGSRETTVWSGCSASSRCTRWISVPTPMTEPRRSGVDRLDDEVGRAHLVGQLADLPGALGVGHDDATGVIGPELLDVLGPEALVDRAVTSPEEEGGVLAVGLGEAAQLVPRVPHPHVGLGEPHGVGRVAAQVLIREEQSLLLSRRSLPGSSAHSRTAWALLDVHTAPPLRPTNDFRAADEFM